MRFIEPPAASNSSPLAALHVFLFDNPKLCRNNQHEASTIPLNMVRGYTSHLKPSVREHMQNWRDQCWKHAAERTGDPYTEPALQYLEQQNFSRDHRNAKVWLVHVNGVILGWVAQLQCANTNIDSYDVFLFNDGTVLDPEILRFGHSTKREELFMAGYFGDGMKPEINRLVTAGASVMYRTGASIWRFMFDPTNQMQCVVELCRHLAEPLGGTLIELRNIPAVAVIDTAELLFLQPMDAALQVPCLLRENSAQTRMRVLLHPEHHSIIYLHGIRVCSIASTLRLEFGIDYHGQICPEMGIGRDRESVKYEFFLRKVLELCGQVEQQAQAQQNAAHALTLNRLRHAVFLSFAKQENFLACYQLFKYCHNDAAKFVADFFVEGFLLHHSPEPLKHLLAQQPRPSQACDALSPKLVPVKDNENENLKDEEALFDIKCVKLHNMQLLECLQYSSLCNTMERVRKRFAVSFVCLPEYVLDVYANEHELRQALPYPAAISSRLPLQPWPNEIHRGLAQHLRNVMVSLFSDEQRFPAWALRFKNFAADTGACHNPRGVTPIEHEGRAYFMIDSRQYSPDNVHVKLRKEDPTFVCEGVGCGCLHAQLLDDLVTAAATRYPALYGPYSSQRKILDNRMRRRLLGQLNPVKMPDSTHAPPPPPSERSSTADSVMDPNATQQHQSAMADHPQQIAERALQCLLLSATVPSASSQSIFQAAIAATTLLQHCIQSGSQSLELEKHPDLSRLLEQKGISMPCYIDRSCFAEASTFLPLFVELGTMVRNLWHMVFKCSTASLNLFYERKTRIAFNRQKQLFFNVHYLEKWKCAGNTTTVDRVAFWFCVMCHELAHNQVEAHNQQHEELQETLLHAFLPTLLQKWQDVVANVICVQN